MASVDMLMLVSTIGGASLDGSSQLHIWGPSLLALPALALLQYCHLLVRGLGMEFLCKRA